MLLQQEKTRNRNMVTYKLPIRLVSEPNQRCHWSQRHKRAKAHQKAAMVIERHPLPCVVTITRLGPKMLDDDNNVAAAKFLRDSIAARLGVDDGSDQVEWRYKQDKGDYEVIVHIEPRRE